MIKPENFYQLRFKTLFPKAKTDRVENYSYNGKVWIGETDIFSHCLQPLSNIGQTKSLAINLENYSQEDTKFAFTILDINLTKNSKLQDVISIFGDYIEEYKFLNDRKTYIFHDKKEVYSIDMTFLETDKLIFCEINIKS